MILEILHTLISVGAFFAVFYFVLFSILKDVEKGKLDKTCPHCKDSLGKGWKSRLMLVRE